MLYLFDANVLIAAHRDYYPVKRVPEYWDWLQHLAELGTVKVPWEILDEVKRGTRQDDLIKWLKNETVRDVLVFDEDPDLTLVRRVIEQGYAPDLDEAELEKLGRDPFLIAYALKEPTRRCIVTAEVRDPGRSVRIERFPMSPRGSESGHLTRSSLRVSWISRRTGEGRRSDLWETPWDLPSMKNGGVSRQRRK